MILTWMLMKIYFGIEGMWSQRLSWNARSWKYGTSQKLLEKGVVDMIRISDARMSGTAFGTVILHVAPESSVGGPLALIKTGDMIELDVEQRRLHLDVSDDILQNRRNELVLEDPTYVRGYYRLYIDSVTQADEGADFSFLVGKSSHIITRESH